MKTIPQSVCLLFTLISCSLLAGQGVFSPEIPSATITPHRAELQMSSSDYQSITDMRGAKVTVPAQEFRLDDQVFPAREIKIRGNSALNFQRKSFTVQLEDRQPIDFGDTVKVRKKFFLISMSMDAHYFHNRFAFLCLRELDLFNVPNTYTELFINGHSEGLYLLMERPEDYIMDDLGAQFFMRRTYGGRIDEYEVADDVRKWQVQNFVSRYSNLLQESMEYEGKSLKRVLEKEVDLTAYLRWMAFNYWVRNGDYTDEVFFYALSSKEPMRIMAWDYDDIFAPKPHEGLIKRQERVGDRMIFSGEAFLDRIIARDDLLYEMYLQEMAYVMHHFTPERIKQIMEQVYAELYPYFQNQDILEASLNDKNAGTSLKALQAAMELVYREYLVQRREEILRELGR